MAVHHSTAAFMDHVASLSAADKQALFAIPKAQVLQAVAQLATCQRCLFVRHVLSAFMDVRAPLQPHPPLPSATPPSDSRQHEQPEPLQDSPPGQQNDLASSSYLVPPSSLLPAAASMDPACCTRSSSSLPEVQPGQQQQQQQQFPRASMLLPFLMDASSKYKLASLLQFVWKDPDVVTLNPSLFKSSTTPSFASRQHGSDCLVSAFLMEALACIQELTCEVGDCSRHGSLPGPAEIESTERRLEAQLQSAASGLQALGVLQERHAAAGSTGGTGSLVHSSSPRSGVGEVMHDPMRAGFGPGADGNFGQPFNETARRHTHLGQWPAETQGEQGGWVGEGTVGLQGGRMEGDGGGWPAHALDQLPESSGAGGRVRAAGSSGGSGSSNTAHCSSGSGNGSSSGGGDGSGDGSSSGGDDISGRASHGGSRGGGQNGMGCPSAGGLAPEWQTPHGGSRIVAYVSPAGALPIDPFEAAAAVTAAAATAAAAVPSPARQHPLRLSSLAHAVAAAAAVASSPSRHHASTAATPTRREGALAAAASPSRHHFSVAATPSRHDAAPTGVAPFASPNPAARFLPPQQLPTEAQRPLFESEAPDVPALAAPHVRSSVGAGPASSEPSGPLEVLSLVDEAVVASLPEEMQGRVRALQRELLQLHQRRARIHKARQHGMEAAAKQLLLLLLRACWQRVVRAYCAAQADHALESLLQGQSNSQQQQQQHPQAGRSSSLDPFAALGAGQAVSAAAAGLRSQSFPASQPEAARCQAAAGGQAGQPSRQSVQSAPCACCSGGVCCPLHVEWQLAKLAMRDRACELEEELNCRQAESDCLLSELAAARDELALMQARLDEALALADAARRRAEAAVNSQPMAAAGCSMEQQQAQQQQRQQPVLGCLPDEAVLKGMGSKELEGMQGQYEAALQRIRTVHMQVVAAEREACPVCWEERRGVVFGCGHSTCVACGDKLSACPICRLKIGLRIRMY